MALRQIIAMAACAALIGIGPAFAAADAKAPVIDQSKPVPTQTIKPPAAPGPDGDSGDADTPAENVPAPPSNEPVPVVEYDASKLPAPVAALRTKLLDAAKTGDISLLKPIIEANKPPPNLGANDGDPTDPVEYLKSLSGDPDGREVLAILSEILEAGYVHVDAGTPDEMYVWPYFARYPMDKLTPPQLVELFKLLTASDFDEMKSFGAYLFYRVGIKPDGHWAYFQAGD